MPRWVSESQILSTVCHPPNRNENHVLHLIVIALAALWAWESLRYAYARYAPGLHSATAPLHPLVVAGFAWLAWYLGNPWALVGAAAGLTGLIHIVITRLVGEPEVQQFPIQRRTRPGLPSLP